MAKVDPSNIELIYCLCIFPLNYDVPASSPNIKIPHPSHRTKVKKYTSETAYEWCGIFTKWQHHAESPGADFSHLSTKEIRRSRRASAVPAVAPWAPGPSVLPAAQQAGRTWQNHIGTALPHLPYTDPCHTSMAPINSWHYLTHISSDTKLRLQSVTAPRKPRSLVPLNTFL